MLTGAIIAGVVFGLYFTLVGLGLNLVFGVMRIVNLAHGDFLMLGGIAAWLLFCQLRPAPAGRPPAWCWWCSSLVGLPIYYLVVPRLLRSRDSEMLSLILFFGLSQMIEAVTTIAFGATERSLPPRLMGVGPSSCPGHSACRKPGSSAPPSAPSPSLLRVSLSVSHAARHADPRGDGQPRRGAGDRHRRQFRFGHRLRHQHRPGRQSPACSRPFILGSITPNMGVADQHHRLRRHRRRHPGQSARHRAGRHHLRRVADADADLPEFLGQPAAQPAADRRAAGPARGHPRPEGAPCMTPHGLAPRPGGRAGRSIAAVVIVMAGDAAASIRTS